jgi:CspA family cold shock protein
VLFSQHKPPLTQKPVDEGPLLILDKMLFFFKIKAKPFFLIKQRTFVLAHCHITFFSFFTMNTGTVKFFNSTKGFGFIVDSSSKEEIFVHVSGLVDEIREGDTVTFDTARGKKGMNAVNVKLS